MRCCTRFSSMSRIGATVPSPRGWNDTILSSRFMNSGVNLRRAASTPARAILLVHLVVDDRLGRFGCDLRRAQSRASERSMADISAAPRLLVMKIMAREKSTLRLSPRVSVALSRMPSSRFHSASLRLFDFVEQHEAELHVFRVELIQNFLAQAADAFRGVPDIPEANRSASRFRGCAGTPRNRF